MTHFHQISTTDPMTEHDIPDTEGLPLVGLKTFYLQPYPGCAGGFLPRVRHFPAAESPLSHRVRIASPIGIHLADIALNNLPQQIFEPLTICPVDSRHFHTHYVFRMGIDGKMDLPLFPSETWERTA